MFLFPEVLLDSRFWTGLSLVDVPLGVVVSTLFSVVIVMEVVLVSGVTGILSIVVDSFLVIICVVVIHCGGLLVFSGSKVVEAG